MFIGKRFNPSLLPSAISPVGLGCWIHRQHLCRWGTPLLTSVLDRRLDNLRPFGLGCRIHRLHLCSWVTLLLTSVLDRKLDNLSPLGLGCWIHRLHVCRGIRHPSTILHCYCYNAMPENICVQRNDKQQIEIFMFDRSTWNHLTVYKWLS